MTYAETVVGPDGHPLDQIRLTGVTAVGHHGVLPAERVEGQTFRADVCLHLDTSRAAVSDDLDATVSYAEVAEDVHAILAGDPVDLVETVAERIAAAVLARPAVHAVDVRVHKPEAPIAVPFEDVEIVVRRDRTRPPAVAAPTSGHGAEAPEQEPTVGTPALALVPDLDDEPAASPVEAVAAEPVVAFEPEPEPAVEPEPVVDPLDASPASPVEAVLALGANLGDPQSTLRAAVTDIDRVPGVQVMEVSPLARTAAVGPEQPDYLNAVLIVHTTLSPRDLLSVCQEVELLHGRVREERWGPRTLDVDVVQYGTLTVASDGLDLPHPRAHERAFVLVPWAELDPEAVLGGLGGGPVAQLAATAPDRGGIRWLALDWLTEPALTGAIPEQADAAEDPAEDVASHAAVEELQPGPAAPADVPVQATGEPTPSWGAQQAPAWTPEQPQTWTPEQQPEQPQAWTPEQQPEAPGQAWAPEQQPEQPQAWTPEPVAVEPSYGRPEQPQEWAPEQQAAQPAWEPEQPQAWTPEQVPAAPQPAPPVWEAEQQAQQPAWEPQQPAQPQAWTPEPRPADAHPGHEPAPVWSPQQAPAPPQAAAQPQAPVWTPEPAGEQPAPWTPEQAPQQTWEPAPAPAQEWAPEQPQAWAPVSEQQPQAWPSAAPASPVVEGSPWGPLAGAPDAAPAPSALPVPSAASPAFPTPTGRTETPAAPPAFPTRAPETAHPAEPYRAGQAAAPHLPAQPVEQPYRPETYVAQDEAPAFTERQEPPAYVPDGHAPAAALPVATVRVPPSLPPQGPGVGADPAGRA